MDDRTARAIASLGAFQEAARSFGIAEEDLSQALASIAETFAGLSPAAALGFREDPPGDRFETLLDLARAGDEATFKELARAVGVSADTLDALWTGTLARVRA